MFNQNRLLKHVISLKKLHDKLTDFEAIIKQEELVTAPTMTANFVRKVKGMSIHNKKITTLRVILQIIFNLAITTIMKEESLISSVQAI